MEFALDNLPSEVEALKALLRNKEQQFEEELRKRDNALEEARGKISHLEQLLKVFRHKTYGPSSEQHPGQLSLFNEPETSSADAEVLKAKVEGHDRRRPKRRPLPADLPHVDYTYELSEKERVCPCGGQLEPFGEEVSEQLDIIPAKLQVLRHRRLKYGCPSCKTNVKTAKLPVQPIPKSNASAGTLAYVATAKYVDHLPLYRQEEIFRRLGIDMPRATLARWMMALAELLRPLYNLMRDDLLEAEVLLMDETTVQVLKGSGKKPTSDNYMWVQCRAGPGKRVVLFHYDPTRSASCAKDLLLGYSGYLMTDGYEAYKAVASARPDLIHCGCWDHARRRFFDAVKAEGKQTEPSIAAVGLSYIQALYAIERNVKEADDNRRSILRNLYSRSVLDHLRRWLDRVMSMVAPKSLTGQALNYLHSEWPRLVRYLENPSIPIANILAENAIRPFAIGRKNWLFSDTRQGAEASSIIFSIIETAKANGREPYAYLRHVIAEMPKLQTADEIAALLPYHLN